MTEKYYRDDFRVEVEFDRPIGTDVDFAGTLYTEETLATRRVRFGRRGGQEQGCEVSADGFKVTIPADGHQLSPGDGLLEMVYLVPAQELPDGSRKIVRRYRLDLRLTAHEPAAGCGGGEGCTCTPAVVTAKVEIPWQYVHDTDVYNEVLERVNGTFAAILGTDDVKPAPAPTPSAGARAVSRPMLRRGLLNLRSARPDCVYNAHVFSRSTIYDNKLKEEDRTYIQVKVPMADGESLDLSKWFKPDDILDLVSTAPHYSDTQFILTGGILKCETDCETATAVISVKWPIGHYTGFIRMVESRIVEAHYGDLDYPETGIPHINPQDLEPLIDEIAYRHTVVFPYVNGRCVEIQRHRKNSHLVNPGGADYTHILRKKFRKFNFSLRDTEITGGKSLQRIKVMILRARYKSRKGYAGPWSYFTYRGNLSEL